MNTDSQELKMIILLNTAEYCKRHSIKVLIDECLVNENFTDIDEYQSPDRWSASQKRPYYQMRGKRITPEQAFEIISRKDNFFGNINLKNYSFNHFSINWFENSVFGKFGFIHPNGIVGTNDYMRYKYPDTDELIEDLKSMVANFPYLDLFIAISDWHEMPPYEWERLFKSCEKFKLSYDKYEDFYDNIEAGVWVHDKTIEFVGPERALELYRQYEELYGEKDERVYHRDYYSDFEPDVVTRDYLRRCLKETYGIEDPDKFLEEHVNLREIEHLK